MNTSDFMETQLAKDPAILGWPAMLPIEIALGEDTPNNIREAYGVDDEKWAYLLDHEPFRLAVRDATLAMQEDGYSFKIKAKMQAEGLLATSWRLIHDKDTPAAVKADLIKFTARLAGYDIKPTSGTPGEQAPGFSIVINLDDKRSERLIDANGISVVPHIAGPVR